MIQITAPHFCAGLVIRLGMVVQAAPILRYMEGWPVQRVVDYCERKRWKWAGI